MAQNKDISFNRDHSVTDDSVCIGRRHTLWTRTVLPVLSRHLHLSSNTKTQTCMVGEKPWNGQAYSDCHQATPNSTLTLKESDQMSNEASKPKHISALPISYHPTFENNALLQQRKSRKQYIRTSTGLAICKNKMIIPGTAMASCAAEAMSYLPFIPTTNSHSHSNTFLSPSFTPYAALSMSSKSPTRCPTPMITEIMSTTEANEVSSTSTSPTVAEEATSSSVAHRANDLPPMMGLSDRPIELDYQLMGKLGEGAFGQVQRAIHLASGDEVAIKIIERSQLTTPRQCRNAEREVRLMSLLHHPNIVSVREIRVLRDRYVIVMERSKGGELFDYIVRSGRLCEPTARSFFRQIVSAVRYCHEHSIIHRDLKPENILLDATRTRVYLIDFGFGNTYRPDHLHQTFCGSPFYAAPEMLRGVPYVGPEVDVWSLGVVLYAMLCGRLPFDAKEGRELCNKVCQGKYHLPSYVSPEAADLISRMMVVDPNRRATIQEVAIHPWTLMGYQKMPPITHPPRPTVIASPHPWSVQQLVSFGYRSSHVVRALRDPHLGRHPVKSLYHLCEDVRIRWELTKYRREYTHQQTVPTLERTTSKRSSTPSSSGTGLAPSTCIASKHSSIGPAMTVRSTSSSATKHRSVPTHHTAERMRMLLHRVTGVSNKGDDNATPRSTTMHLTAVNTSTYVTTVRRKSIDMSRSSVDDTTRVQSSLLKHDGVTSLSAISSLTATTYNPDRTNLNSKQNTSTRPATVHGCVDMRPPPNESTPLRDSEHTLIQPAQPSQPSHQHRFSTKSAFSGLSSITRTTCATILSDTDTSSACTSTHSSTLDDSHDVSLLCDDKSKTPIVDKPLRHESQRQRHRPPGRLSVEQHSKRGASTAIMPSLMRTGRHGGGSGSGRAERKGFSSVAPKMSLHRLRSTCRKWVGKLLPSNRPGRHGPAASDNASRTNVSSHTETSFRSTTLSSVTMPTAFARLSRF